MDLESRGSNLGFHISDIESRISNRIWISNLGPRLLNLAAIHICAWYHKRVIIIGIFERFKKTLMKSYVASLGLRSCLCCLTRLIYTWSKKGLCRPYATPVLHKMQLTPQREFTRHIFYTPNLQIWMLKMKKKKIRSQNNPTAAIAALQ